MKTLDKTNKQIPALSHAEQRAATWMTSRHFYKKCGVTEALGGSEEHTMGKTWALKTLSEKVNKTSEMKF